MTRNTQMILQSYQDKGNAFCKANNKTKPHQMPFDKFKDIYKSHSLRWNMNAGSKKKDAQNGESVLHSQIKQSKTCKNDNPLFQTYSQHARNNNQNININDNIHKEYNTKILITNSNQRYDDSISRNTFSNPDLTAHPPHFRAISLNEDEMTIKGQDLPRFSQTNQKEKRRSTNLTKINHQLFTSISKDYLKSKYYLKTHTKNKSLMTNYIKPNENFEKDNCNLHTKSDFSYTPTHCKSVSLNAQFTNAINSSNPIKLILKAKEIKAPDPQFETPKLIVKTNKRLLNGTDLKDNQEEEKRFEKRQSDILIEFSSSSTPNNTIDNKDNTFVTEDEILPIKEPDTKFPDRRVLSYSKCRKSDTQDTYHSSIQSDAKKNNSGSSDYSCNKASLRPKSKKNSRLNRHYQSQLSKISEISKCKMLQDKTENNNTDERLTKSDDDILDRSPINQDIQKTRTLTKTSLTFLNHMSKSQFNPINSVLVSSSETNSKKKTYIKKRCNRRSYTTHTLIKVSEKANRRTYKLLFKANQRVKALELFVNQYYNNDINKRLTMSKRFPEVKDDLLQRALKSIKLKQQPNNLYKERSVFHRYQCIYSKEEIFQYANLHLFLSELIKYFYTYHPYICLNHHHNINFLANKYLYVNISLKVFTHMFFYEEFEFEKRATIFNNFKLLQEERLMPKMSKRKKWTNILTLMPVFGELTYLSTMFYNQFMFSDHMLTEESSETIFSQMSKSQSNTNLSKPNSKRNNNSRETSQSIYSNVKSQFYSPNHNKNKKVKSKKNTKSSFKLKIKTASFQNEFSDTLLNSRFMTRNHHSRAHK